MAFISRRSAILAVAFLLAACRSQIQHGLNERDANEIVAVLVSRGFDARKVAEKSKKPAWAIEVDEPHATSALRILTELKLPRPVRATTHDLTSQVGLIETPGAEKLRQLEALEGDIEQMLEGMDGVASAGVELVVPAAPRPGAPAVPSKASALIRVHPVSLERLIQQREGIRALIAASVDGLRPDEVVVIFDPVTSHVIGPVAAEPVGDKVRATVLVMGLLMLLLASGLVIAAVQLRRATTDSKAITEKLPVTPPLPELPKAPPSRPVVNTNVQRKVA